MQPAAAPSRKRLGAAVKTYQRATDIPAVPGRPAPPGAGTGRVGLAEVAYQRGELDDALRHVTESIPLAKNDLYTQPLATGLATLAWIRHARGDPAGALDALTTAESLTDAEPLRLDILILRADAATRLGRTADADAALARASELASDDQIAGARADVALARGDASAAIALLRNALDRSPESAPLWTALGGTYGRTGDLGHAIEAYERSVALEPTALACKTLAALVFESLLFVILARESFDDANR